MHEIFNMLLAVFDRAALMLICLFFLIRIRLFRELLHKSAHSPKELLAVTAIFSLFALFSTWSGVPVEGSLVNVRIIAVMSGGILFGPWVGIITGVIAGIHRYLIDIGIGQVMDHQHIVAFRQRHYFFEELQFHALRGWV